jgi:two-component system, OmpR family, phosphate regulon sensor histidine kinase PhoR
VWVTDLTPKHLGRTIIRRLAAAVLLSILPPAILLAVLAGRGSLSLVLLAVVLCIALAGGIAASAMVVRVLIERKQSLEAAAEELEARRRPVRLATGDYLVGLAEQRLLTAADAMVREVESLAEQREELEVILRSMSEGVVVTDAHGEVMLINGVAREMLELGHEVDYRGRSLVEICRDPAIQQLVAGPSEHRDEWPESIELTIQRTGPLRRLRVTAGAVGTSSRGHAAWVLLFYDVTQLKAYEGLRSDFIANLTHEIRTPLSALCGYAETLLEGVDDPDAQRRFLGIIERQSHRLARLVDDLVSLSDLERGLTPMRLQALDAKRLFEEAVELMREPAERQGVELAIQSPEGVALVGDHDRLYQVLLNLLDNAIKYTPRGGRVTISVGSAVTQDSGAKPAVELSVSDTGEGIPAQHIPRLTERFYRVDRARSRELGGTGLGLAIVKHIVQLHQGDLQIESRLREGTTVRIRLPMPPAAAAEQPPAVRAAS